MLHLSRIESTCLFKLMAGNMFSMLTKKHLVHLFTYIAWIHLLDCLAKLRIRLNLLISHYVLKLLYFTMKTYFVYHIAISYTNAIQSYWNYNLSLGSINVTLNDK